MVREQIIARGITNARVVRAMARLPRELFLSEALMNQAYSDGALPSMDGQTISQPYIVALMTDRLNLEASHRVLEIGTGTGYQTALLAMLAKKVCTIECHAGLAAQARSRLERLNLKNVEYHVGDGALGWPNGGPFDRIIVSAATERPAAPWLSQLRAGGILVAPIGRAGDIQTLTLFRRGGFGVTSYPIIQCRFVPLV
ncbi:MAG: protein-L-isoaspartate(D-aspartate) O-methyltransferase [Phycisphaerales bacterium]|nr:protein-L-isoaspartate(D-aspartate) O-methyltransferase [Phycisphaerales bacterium]